ncbi:MAG: polyprenyl synthetase family protein [Planctomycetota bacterium]|nr:MAG: polyprenyl synthetase family protein [Planctomycetota bacterium]
MALQKDVPSFKLIDDELQQVKELINEELAHCPQKSGTGQLVKSLGSRAGKMIRPGLVLLSYHVVRDASNGKPRRGCARNSQYEAIRIAAIVEMIHNAALLHDDVIDEGEKRRGQPTANSLWGNEFAVLLGDFLLSRVFKICADLEPRFQRIISTVATRTCEGELRQILQRQKWDLSESEYIEIITEKTAALFSGSCHLGALLGGASERQVERLNAFGLNAGIAFQITDDLLDIIGDEKRAGKTLGSDIGKNKLTLALIHLLKVVDEKEKGFVISRLNAGGGGKKALIEKLISHGSIDYACVRAKEFVEKAIVALAIFKQSIAKDALVEMARFVERRVV